ncbi:MAG TPA: DNA ligase D [Patescibacteria group bacterium]|nr:DNA ligase D [Patescibacteria group bacterium]
MTLSKYNEKRRFNKTPEPVGKEKKHKGKLEFVIQKHHATQLHYDFRLEAGGVLKSWAVPKGPSLDPATKRLAMMVEDHPYDYRNFEGVIPEGNYGAGNVIIWDQGTYESVVDPQNSEKEILKELNQGSIKFRLFGKKLHGLWALVKLKNAEENAWLLIKDRDEYASDKDITENDKSIISGARVDEINKKQNKNFKKMLESLPKEKPPEFIKPMLATLIDKPFDNKDFIFEIKWDGYRAIADTVGKKVRLYSRNKISFNDHYPEIVEALGNSKINAVLDGEIVVVDDNGKPDFQALQNYRKVKTGNLLYYVFDILFLDGRNLMGLPLIDRKKILEKVIPENSQIKLGTHIEEKGVRFFEAAKKEGIEGVVAKRGDSSYSPGIRGNNWLKIKTHARQEVIICGFTKPKGGRKYFGALILGVYKDNELTYVGHTGSGFDEQSLKDMDGILQKLIVEKSPFKKVPKTNTPATWVKPKLICEVEFSEWTEGGNMRQPIFKGLRTDKDIKEVTTEKAKEEEKVLEDSGIELSNPDKIFWPREKYTKGDLANYYKSISKFILPYLKNRPESLKRYPNGIEGDFFFQKDFTYELPKFADSIKIHSDSEDKEINYLVCNNEETLLYMVNLGCIDINPWNSRVDNLEKPDYLIVDLDPEEIGFDKVIDAALEVRKVLDELEVKSYPKTSGATGIHIYIPTGGEYTHEQGRRLCEVIVNIVNSRVPEYTSITRSPSKRKGKVYLDFLQNRVGQTLASPYSVRPRPHATVSAPLKWSEVKKGLTPDDFTIKNILKRVEKEGDLFKEVLSEELNMKKTLKNLEDKFADIISS